MIKLPELKPWFWVIGVFFIALGPTLDFGLGQGEVLWWEAANALGFVAFAGLLILMENGYRKSGYSHFHRWFGSVIFVSMLLHSLWFLIGDTAVLDYLVPGAPVYMVLGLSAFLVTILLTVSSFKRPRKAAYSNSNSFRFWHNWQSVLIVVLSGFHIVLSGFYFVSSWQWVSLLVLTVMTFVLPAKRTAVKNGGRRQSKREVYIMLAICISAAVIFSLLRGAR